MDKIKLGQEVKDRVTGFKGIAISRVNYLQGCDRIGVAPIVDKDGDLRDVQSFDEPDLIIVGEGILPKPQPKPTETGGIRRHMPTDR